MKKYFYLILLSGILFSCNKEEKTADSFSNKEIVNKQKYQTEVFQLDSEEFSMVMVNRFTGKVFIGKNATGWYEATNAESIPVYKTPTYSINVFKGSGSNLQIALTDEKSGDIYMYIVGHTANFYNTNAPIKALERG